ncbi:MAG: hypothetical protein AAF629_27805 [Chloroflexota bacterium]
MQPSRFSIITVLFVITLLLLGAIYLRAINVNHSLAPAWRGIVPGQTTMKEVVNQLGEPQVTTTCKGQYKDRGDFIAQLNYYNTCLTSSRTHYFHEKLASNIAGGTHEIFYNWNTVSVIVENWFAYSRDDRMTVEDFVAKNGQPEMVTWSGRIVPTNVLLYCDKGLIIHAVKIEITHILYFPPVKLEQCLKTFKAEIALDNPYQDSGLIVSQDPWGYNQQISGAVTPP